MNSTTIRNRTWKYRKGIIKKHNSKCDSCGSNENLEIHHPHYDYFDLKELQVLCRRCHKKLLRKPKRKGISFNFKIPDDLHEEFKIYSIRQKKDMRDILIEQIKKVVKNG